MQNPLGVFPAIFSKLLCSDHLSLGIFLLQLLQPQPHATNADFVRTFRGQVLAERIQN